jgi:hypothetical protein
VTKDSACSEAEAQPLGNTTPARPHSRRHAISGGLDAGGAVLRALARLLLEASGVAMQKASDDNA